MLLEVSRVFVQIMHAILTRPPGVSIDNHLLTPAAAPLITTA